MSANKKTKSSELPEREANFPVKKDGLDEWNDRLDENLETEKDSDPLADEKSKDFFEKNEKLK